MTQIATTATSLPLSQDDVGGISEITILPDGRLYVLGLSEAMLEMLDGAGPWGGLSAGRRVCRSAERDEGSKESRRARNE
jgi:hypothetical protein